MRNKMSQVVYFVEATSFEKYSLWKQYHEKIDWKQESEGFGNTVGEFGGEPIFINFNFAYLYGKLICFYDATSNVVNHQMVESYIKKKYKGISLTDANNFGTALNFCKK